MSRPPSVRRLLVQVVVLSGLFVGLSRLATHPAGKTAGASPPGSATADGSGSGGSSDTLSTTSPDLSFYRSLGSAGGPGDAPAGSIKKDKDAVEPGPDRPAGGTASFLVQTLSTRDGARARRLRDTLAAHGFPAVVSEDQAAGRPVYRVRVGRYRTRAEAEAAARVLRQKQGLSSWILEEGD